VVSIVKARWGHDWGLRGGTRRREPNETKEAPSEGTTALPGGWIANELGTLLSLGILRVLGWDLAGEEGGRVVG
jgi:hypothetical protein